MQGAYLDGAQLQAARLLSSGLRGVTTYTEESIWPPFHDRIRTQIGKDSDLSQAVFKSRFTQDDIDSWVDGLSDDKENGYKATTLREKLQSDIDTLTFAIQGAYTAQEAEQLDCRI